MRDIQRTMSERALELLALPDGKRALLLDIGCGSGLSGEVLSDAGHDWIGVDISPAMLNVAKDQEADGDVVLLDIGHGMPFRESTFDGAISVSAVQWLCNSNTREQVPYKRLLTLFQTLYATLRRGSRYASNHWLICMASRAISHILIIIVRQCRVPVLS